MILSRFHSKSSLRFVRIAVVFFSTRVSGLKKKKALAEVTTPGAVWDLLEMKLRLCDSWFDVYKDPFLVEQLFIRGYQDFLQLFSDMQTIRLIESSFCERIVIYFINNNWPEEYRPEELLEKYFLLDWLACQLVFDRPIKTSQMFLYGAPSTQKTLIINFLSKVLRIYFGTSCKNDFTGADNFFDLWVFDQEYQSEPRDDITHANLLKVLDGQECRLDSKYGEHFIKKVNVPVLMIGNVLPEGVKKPGAMQERFVRMRFTSNIPHLDQGRVISTLYGCIRRRIQSLPEQGILLKGHDEIIEKFRNTGWIESPDPTEVCQDLKLAVSNCRKNFFIWKKK